MTRRPSDGTPFLRMAAGLLLLLLAVACALVFLVGANVISVHGLTSDAVLRDKLDALLSSLGLGTRAAVTGGALLVGLGALWGLGAVVRGARGRPRGSSRYHIVEASEHGLLVVDNSSVETLVRTAVSQVQGVFNVEVTARGGGSGSVQLDVQADVIGGVDIKRVGREAGDNARRAVEKLAGLSVANVTTRVRVDEPRRFLEGLE